jgi:hypothetical protein
VQLLRTSARGIASALVPRNDTVSRKAYFFWAKRAKKPKKGEKNLYFTKKYPSNICTFLQKYAII